MQDSDHYRCGLRKWKSFPLISRISLVLSTVALVLSLIAQCKIG